MSINTIIFDLDGTLVDSADSILNSLQVAFDEKGISPVKPLSSDLIGPPLHDIVSELLPVSDVDLTSKIMTSFKQHYDETGYLHTKVYHRIFEAIESLKANKFNLLIATNKRSIPTKKIINLMDWNDLFSGIYSLDSFNPVFSTKSKLLAHMVYSLNVSSKEIIYIGDRTEDYAAANSIGCNFILAEWGYLNESDKVSCSTHIHSPDMILEAVRKLL
jgi:phosphoglycolate phosphatase